MLARARKACFEPSSLRELPPHLVRQAFDRVGQSLCVRQPHREGIDFLFQDLRLEAPNLLFDLILCRYVAFTYFEVPLQYQVLGRIVERLLPNGYLVIGTHERLPGDVATPAPLAGGPQNLPENGGATRLKAQLGAFSHGTRATPRSVQGHP